MSNFQPPQLPNIPSAPSSPNGAPNISNAPSFESQSPWSRSLGRSKSIKASVTKFMGVSKQLSDLLAQYKITLVTSASEFQETKDFIGSSYVIYLEYSNFIESLQDFLNRYPHFQELAKAIQNNIEKQGIEIQVVSKP